MWISGRRAVRPDREYYRSVRRVRLRTGRGPVMRLQWLGAFLIGFLILIGWLLFH